MSEAELVAWPMVDVIVAVRNEARLITAKLSELDAIDYPAHCLHYVLVDGGSSDGTIAAITGHAAKDARWLSICAGVASKSAQLNEAIGRSQAPWILVTDADARVPRDTLAAARRRSGARSADRRRRDPGGALRAASARRLALADLQLDPAPRGARRRDLGAGGRDVLPVPPRPARSVPRRRAGRRRPRRLSRRRPGRAYRPGRDRRHRAPRRRHDVGLVPSQGGAHDRLPARDLPLRPGDPRDGDADADDPAVAHARAHALSHRRRGRRDPSSA